MTAKKMTIEEMTKAELKAATMGLIGDGVKTIDAGALYGRVRDQANRLGLHVPAWPVFVSVAQEMGHNFKGTPVGAIACTFEVTLPTRGSLLDPNDFAFAIQNPKTQKILGQIMTFEVTIQNLKTWAGWVMKADQADALVRDALRRGRVRINSDRHLIRIPRAGLAGGIVVGDGFDPMEWDEVEASAQAESKKEFCTCDTGTFSWDCGNGHCRACGKRIA